MKFVFNFFLMFSETAHCYKYSAGCVSDACRNTSRSPYKIFSASVPFSPHSAMPIHFIQNLKYPVSFIYICGPTGVGKRNFTALLYESTKEKCVNGIFTGTLEEDRTLFNLLTPNDHYSGRTASLTSKRCVLSYGWSSPLCLYKLYLA